MITIQTICVAAIPEISGKISGEISKGMGGTAGKLGQGFKTGKEKQIIDGKAKWVDANFESYIGSRATEGAKSHFKSP